MSKSRTKQSANALDILDRMVAEDIQVLQMIEEETVNVEVARLIHDARTQAGLTQQALAHLVGTSQPVIARLEDADYEGHSLSMLRRIARALDQRLEVRFVPLHPPPPHPPPHPRRRTGHSTHKTPT